MGLEQKELVEYTLRCDRCDKTEVFTVEIMYEGEPKDLKNAREEGWLEFTSSQHFPRLCSMWLCPIDANKLELWLQFDRTPISATYNQDDEQRFDRVRKQLDPSNERGPWD